MSCRLEALSAGMSQTGETKCRGVLEVDELEIIRDGINFSSLEKLVASTLARGHVRDNFSSL